MEVESIELRVLDDANKKSRSDGEQGLAPSGIAEDPQSSSEINESNSTSLPPIDGGYNAWLFLACCFATELLCFGGAFSFSIFQEYLVQSPTSPLHNKATNVDVSIIGTLLVSLTYFAPGLARGLWARYAHWNRTMGFTCIQSAGISLIIASFGSSVPFLVVFMGLFPGLFLGLASLNFLIWLPQWFFKRRGLALGIAYAGAGSGGIIFPFIFEAALREVGFAWTMRIWAAIIMLGGGVVAYPIRPRIAIRPRTTPMSFGNLFRRRPESNNDTEERGKERWKSWLNALAFTKTPLWITQALATFIASMSFFCISFYLAVYSSSLGLTSSTSTGIVAGFNLAGLSGEIIVGYLCDRFAYPIFIFGIGLIGALSAFLLLGLVQSLLGVVFFVLLFGMAAGSFPSIFTSAAYDVSRLKSMQTANVILSFAFVRGLAAVIGPLIAASLYNPQHNKDQAIFGAFGFDKLIVFVGALMALLAILAPVLTYQRQKVSLIVNQSSLQEQF